MKLPKRLPNFHNHLDPKQVELWYHKTYRDYQFCCGIAKIYVRPNLPDSHNVLELEYTRSGGKITFGEIPEVKGRFPLSQDEKTILLKTLSQHKSVINYKLGDNRVLTDSDWTVIDTDLAAVRNKKIDFLLENS